MKNIRSIFLVISGTFVVLCIGTVYFSLQWIDRQEIPNSINARNTLRLIASVYPLLPSKCGERCVVRSIKISNLVALSAYGKKSPADLSKDLAAGFSLLNAILAKGDFPDRTAEYELSLERLLFFNRMNALAVTWGHRLEGKIFMENAESLQGFAYDEETRTVLRREVFIFRTFQNGRSSDFITNLAAHTTGLTFSDAYELLTSGLVMCANHVEKGAEYLNLALPFISDNRMNLIYAVTRNLDAPLIAAAEKNVVCQNSIAELKTLLGD